MGLYKNFVSQTRKPEGVMGKMMVNGMNSGHAKMADWGFSHLPKIQPDEVVDLGCGGGRNVSELLKKYTSARVLGIDYSEVSVSKATSYNRSLIDQGRCIISQGDVSNLRIGKEKYDLATAFETVYFWPGIQQCFSQVVNTIRPGGYFLIVNEADGVDEGTLKYEKIIDGMKCYTIEQLEEALLASGFSEVVSDHHDTKPWIAVLAKK